MMVEKPVVVVVVVGALVDCGSQVCTEVVGGVCEEEKKLSKGPGGGEEVEVGGGRAGVEAPWPWDASGGTL